MLEPVVIISEIFSLKSGNLEHIFSTEIFFMSHTGFFCQSGQNLHPKIIAALDAHLVGSKIYNSHTKW
jgi:hypothetical protein